MQQKKKTLDKLTLKRCELNEPLPGRNHKNKGEYSNSTVAGSSRFLFLIFIQNEIKRIKINLLMKRKIHAATMRTTFP